MQTDLTLKQKQVFEFIRNKINHDRISPTIREIAGFFGFSSTGTVRDYLKVLSRKGYLRLNKNRARAVELVKEEQGLAIVGMVACGKPQFAQEDIEGYLEFEKLFKFGDSLFCLRAKGDSMSGAGIMEDDILVVQRQAQAQNNEIVVALIADEATVKFLRRRKNGKPDRKPEYFLEAANKKYPDIPVTETVSIIGRVISVIRKYV